MTNSKEIKDPHAERESRNYANPIPSREVILALLDQSSGPMTREQIGEQLNIDGEEQLEALRRRLIAMVRDGQIVGNRKGAFGKVDKMDLLRGRVQGHRDGFGFVSVSDGGDDIYLSNRQMRRVFDGDEVLVRLAAGSRGSRGRREGAIVEVLAHNTTQVAGRYVAERGVHFVRPDNPRIVQDIIIPEDQLNGAQPGQFVVADIVEYPGREKLAIGKIAEVLGDHLAPGMEIDIAIRNHGIPYVWPGEVHELAQKLSPEVAEEDKVDRFDLRDLPLVTIDGEDARDFDDAIFCERKKSGGWRLIVAIADVSHYVKVHDALDREAIVRGNSVYFPDYVVPMLPEILSNGLCSLNPKVDRLCMVCEMTISSRGRISGYQFYEGVMHSHARLTYTQVGQMLADRDKPRSGIRQEFHSILPQIDTLGELYGALRQERESRGAIDFETQETRIIFDEQRKIERIVPIARNDAHKLIEECMLAANVCTAKLLEHHKVPALYRVHEGPKEQKLELLREFLGGLGLGVRGGTKVTPQDYQEVLQSIGGRADAHLIQMVMLRSMNQAVYQPENKGHFGLAYSGYTHFTSPIRRYADLLVHRAIRRVIRSDMETQKAKRHPQAKLLPVEKIYPYKLEDMVTLGEQCSLTERRADDATRDVISWLKCEYLKDRVGEVFPGVVASVAPFGLFVELKDLYVEGLVHITSLPQDYYHHEPAQHRLVGERTHKSFALGDEITVQVIRVDLDERKIDFELVQVKSSRRKKPVVSEKAKALADDYEEEQKPKTRRRRRKPKPAGDEASSPTAKSSAAAKAPSGRGKAPRGQAKAPSGRAEAPSGRTEAPSSEGKAPSTWEEKASIGREKASDTWKKAVGGYKKAVGSAKKAIDDWKKSAGEKDRSDKDDRR